MPTQRTTAVSDLEGAMLAGFGLASWTYTPHLALGNSAATSQRIHVSALPLKGGTLVTNIWVHVATAAAGTTPTSIYLALLDAAGNRRALTANLNADAKWTALGWKSFAVTTPYTVPADGLYYVAFLKDGVFGTTDVQLGRAFGVLLDTTPLGSNNLHPAGNAGSAQTAIGAGPLTIGVAAGDIAFWYAVN